MGQRTLPTVLWYVTQSFHHWFVPPSQPQVTSVVEHLLTRAWGSPPIHRILFTCRVYQYVSDVTFQRNFQAFRLFSLSPACRPSLLISVIRVVRAFVSFATMVNLLVFASFRMCKGSHFFLREYKPCVYLGHRLRGRYPGKGLSTHLRIWNQTPLYIFATCWDWCPCLIERVRRLLLHCLHDSCSSWILSRCLRQYSSIQQSVNTS